MGINWYMNPAVKLALDYQYIDVSRLQPPAAAATATLPALNVGQKLSTFGLRFQLAI